MFTYTNATIEQYSFWNGNTKMCPLGELAISEKHSVENVIFVNVFCDEN